MSKTCITPDCTNPKYSLDMCRQCYQRARYWNDRTLREKTDHLRKLKIRSNSMQQQIGNVRIASRRRTG